MTNRMIRAALLATTSLIPAGLHADGPLPTDPTVVSGDITISNPGPTYLLVQQGGQFGVINWGSFSIGEGNAVNFQNGSGATLNRVTGGDLSAIYGRLDATGTVYLINRNGIIVGRNGEVRTGGSFVASTLNLTNGDFLDGGDATFRGDSGATVVNLGRVSSLGGDVAILAQDVVNEGTISAPGGTVGLVAGREILMRDGAVADGMFAVKVGGSDTSVTDRGAIAAAAAELRANGGNVYALAGNTEGTIAATGVEKRDGRVFLTAGKGGAVTVDKEVSAQDADGSGGMILVDGDQVTVEGLLNASGTEGGEVRLTSGVETVFSGEILAFGDGSADSGGFVEVSGAHLRFDGEVLTGGGTVLIDPNNIEIASNDILILSGATGITSTAVETLLRTQDVIIETSGSDGEAGTILVSSAVNWSSEFGLSLLAHGDLVLLANVLGTGGANGLNLVAGWDGSTSTTAFDPAPFLTADVASTTLFGNANGIAYGIVTASTDATGSIIIDNARVGVADGATRAFGNGIALTGSNSAAQLGFNITNLSGINPTGDIVVRATGDITIEAGANIDAAAQIGHIGIDYSDSSLAGGFDASGDILVEAGGGITLLGGTSSNTYAMIGHGSRAYFSFLMAQGNRSGGIEVNALGEISIDASNGAFASEAWIGHETASGTITSDILVTAANFDQDAGTSVGAGGTGSLHIGMLSENTAFGNVTYRATDGTAGAGLNLLGSTGPTSCECDFVNTAFDLVVQSAGDLLLDTGFQFSNTGGGNLALAGLNFLNNSGGDAFGTMKGHWLIYSTRPEQNTGDIGTLVGAFVATDIVFDPNNPFPTGRDTFSFAGNGLMYSAVPTVTVGDVTMTYGDSLVLPGFDVTVGGVSVDPAAWGITVDGIFLDETFITRSAAGHINAGNYLNVLGFSFGTIPELNGFSYVFAEQGSLTVNRATLDASIIGAPVKTYDGTTDATLTAADFLLSGFVDGEGASVTQTLGSYDTANAGSEIGVTATLGAGDFAADLGTLLSNYILPTSAIGFGAIDQATLTAAITGTPTKTYDGTTDALLASGDFTLTGFTTGEGATVTQTAGTYASANAGASVGVSTVLGSTDFTADSGTLLSNYILPTLASGFGAIDQAVLTAAITGTPTKTYDGTTDAVLTAGDFTLSGFISGEGGFVTQTAGSYASADAGASVAVSALLASGDFAAFRGTLLSNYVLPASASGFGAIDRAALTASITGTPTKTYDGTDLATLTAGDFLLSGFVGSQGATVTQTEGTYDSVNAGSEIGVTATLGVGDFAAGLGTNLANYILPTSASGFGAIDRALLTAAITGTPTKTYDGTTNAVLTAGDFTLSGFATGEGASVTQTAGTYSSANAAASVAVTAMLAAGDFAADSGTLLSNYVLPVSASGTGAIDRAALTVAISGTPTKIYDGTDAATLTAGDFLLTGFVGDEGASITQTSGSYAGADAGTAVAVSASLGAGDFAAGTGTNLANYILPVIARGTGVIQRALLTADIVGLPTRPFDGTTIATLTADNFLLSGFVAGQGATVTQTTGSYASAQVGTTQVSADLAAADLAADTGTNLNNYVLPTRAIGTGEITEFVPEQPFIPQLIPLQTFEITPLGEDSGPAGGLEVLDSETTQAILDEIRAGAAFCKALVREEYVIDCLSDRLQSVADGLSAVGEYSEVRRALEDAAQQLHALVLANASQELAQQVMRAGGQRSSRPLTAVSTDALGSVNAQAAGIIEEAGLVLLRSSTGSAERREAFSQVAQVVNSTKVLLRSS